MNIPPGKTVLIAPLDWGLGHATRCMPVIDRLVKNGTNVHLAGNGASFYFLKDKYPQLAAHELPGYDIHYPLGKNASVQILLQTPRMFRTIGKEHECIEEIVSSKGIDCIISDNRYGVWNKKCRNIMICHHLAIQSPDGFSWMNPFFLRGHFHMMRNFDSLWIPDEPGENNLSGQLSHGFNIPIPHCYIGIQSRFSDASQFQNSAPNKKYKIVALLSGNEPQRSFFEDQLRPQLQSIDTDSILIRGVAEKKEFSVSGNMDAVSYLHAHELYPLLQEAEAIICRSGYSTLMDLAVLGKKAILVPTPGQTEQEYLANTLSKKGMAVAVKQKDFDLKKSMEMLGKIKGFEGWETDAALLEQSLERDVWSTG